MGRLIPIGALDPASANGLLSNRIEERSIVILSLHEHRLLKSLQTQTHMFLFSTYRNT